jgi:hypothetical protein
MACFTGSVLLPYAVLTSFVQLYLSWTSTWYNSTREVALAQDSATTQQHSSLDPPTDQEIKVSQIHPPAPDQQPEDTVTPSQSCHPSQSTPLKQCFQIDPEIKFPLWSPTEFPPDLPSQGHCWADGLLHLFKLIPGITISVLQTIS